MEKIRFQKPVLFHACSSCLTGIFHAWKVSPEFHRLRKWRNRQFLLPMSFKCISLIKMQLKCRLTRNLKQLVLCLPSCSLVSCRLHHCSNGELYYFRLQLCAPSISSAAAECTSSIQEVTAASVLLKIIRFLTLLPFSFPKHFSNSVRKGIF